MKVSQFMYEMSTTAAVFGRETGATVTFEGDRAFTDGQRINLPSLPLDAELTPNILQTMRGYVDHEAGHLRHSDMPRIKDFYGRCINNGRENLKSLHNSIEDVFIEEKVTKNYAGSYKNLYTTGEAVKERELQAVKELKSMTGETPFTPEAIGMFLRSANKAYRRKNNFHDQVYNKMTEEQKAWIERWSEDISNCENTEDNINLAKAIYKKVEEWQQQEPDEGMGDPQDFDPSDGADFDEGEPLLDGEGEGQGEPQEGIGEDLGKALFSPKEKQVVSGKDSPEEEGAPAKTILDEVGELIGAKGYKVYSTKYDTIYKKGMTRRSHHNSSLYKIVNETNASNYEKTKSGLSDTIRVLKAKLRRLLLARVKRDWDVGRMDGALDTKRLTSAVLGAENVFKKRMDQEDQDTAIIVLIDLSGSMSGYPARVAEEAAIAMAECFEGTQFKVKFQGFCNSRSGGHGYDSRGSGGLYHRYEDTSMVVFKDFDTPLRKARGSMGNITGAVGGNNSDYDFIEASLSELDKRPEKRKILFVLSDGSPACVTDAPISEHFRFCKEAIQKASKRGVECVGIGINDNSVKNIYPNVMVINNVSELPNKIFKKLQEFI